MRGRCPPPQLTSFTPARGSVGSTVAFQGELPVCEPNHVCTFGLEFTGTFTSASGETEQVNFKTGSVRQSDGSTLVWGSLGPQCNPFSKNCTAIGKFHGTVTPILTDLVANLSSAGRPMDMTYEISPSLFVEKFTPKPFDCGRPVQALIVSTPYRLCVKAVGITPAQVAYTVSFPGNEARMPSFQVVHNTNGRTTDCLGDSEVFETPGKQPDLAAFPMAITVQARDASGASTTNAFASTVHFPVELHQDGAQYQVEYQEPRAVTGCFTGGPVVPGQAQFTISYSESRTRSMTLTVSNNWSRSSSVDNGRVLSWSESSSTSDQDSFNESFNIAGRTVTVANSDATSTTPATISINEQTSTGGGTSAGGQLGVKNSSWVQVDPITRNFTAGCPVEIPPEGTAGYQDAVNRARELNCYQAGPGAFSMTSGKSDTTGSTSAFAINGAVNGPGGYWTTTQGGQQLSVGDVVATSNSSSTQAATPESIAAETAARLRQLPINGMLLATSTDILGISNTASIARNTQSVFSKTFSTGETSSYGSSSSTGDSGGTSESLAEQVSTSYSDTQQFSQTCLPGNYCVMYRQAVKNRTRAALVSYNMCGVATMIGKMAYDDWLFNYAIAQGPSCAPFPKPTLPAAQCLEPPCNEFKER